MYLVVLELAKVDHRVVVDIALVEYDVHFRAQVRHAEFGQVLVVERVSECERE